MENTSETLVAAPVEQSVSAGSKIKLPRAFAALRHRNFQLYFSGMLISAAGMWMQAIAQSWLVYQLTHSEFALGVVSFCSAIPVLIFTPFAGVVVDRIPKRKVLYITQVVAMVLALSLATLTFLDLVREWHIMVMAALLGIVNSFDAPARQAFVVDLVGKEDLPNAIALNSMMFNSARVIGPAVAAILLAAVGPAWCFTINGISYIAVLAGMIFMKLAPHVRPPGQIAPVKQLVEGLTYVKTRPEMWGLLLLAVGFSSFAMSYATLLPAFVVDTLNAGAEAFGYIDAATGIGAVIAALLVAQFSGQSKRGVWLWAANFGFPIALTIFAFTRTLAPALIVSVVLGVGFMTHMMMANTLLQTRVDDALRGRVLSLYTLTIFGITPFGNLLAGWLGENLGLMPAMLIMGGTAFIIGRIVFRVAPGIRQLV